MPNRITSKAGSVYSPVSVVSINSKALLTHMVIAEGRSRAGNISSRLCQIFHAAGRVARFRDCPTRQCQQSMVSPRRWALPSASLRALQPLPRDEARFCGRRRWLRSRKLRMVAGYMGRAAAHEARFRVNDTKIRYSLTLYGGNG